MESKGFSKLTSGLKNVLKQNEEFQNLKNDLLDRIKRNIESDVFKFIKESSKYSEIYEILLNIEDKIHDFDTSDELHFLNYINQHVLSLEKSIQEIENRKDRYVDGFIFALTDGECLSLQHKTFLIHKEISDFLHIKNSFDEYVVGYLKSAVEVVDNELKSFRQKRNLVDNHLTEDIYSNAVNKYLKLESSYRKYFYIGIGLMLFITIFLLVLKPYLLVWFALNTVEFWVLKVSTLVVGITLISYFLKQSSHYQRLADQNYQTQVELQAYPSFMESIPTEEATAVRKELALKYFGRELDGSVHKDMSNLISDQMKNTTEMVKATTDAIKNLGSNTSSGGK